LKGWEHIPLSENPVAGRQAERYQGHDDTYLLGGCRDESAVLAQLNSLILALDMARGSCSELINAALQMIESRSSDTTVLDMQEGRLKDLMNQECKILKVYTSASAIAVAAASEAVQSLEENLKLSADYYRAIHAAASEVKSLCVNARAEMELSNLGSTR